MSYYPEYFDDFVISHLIIVEALKEYTYLCKMKTSDVKKIRTGRPHIHFKCV